MEKNPMLTGLALFFRLQLDCNSEERLFCIKY